MRSLTFGLGPTVYFLALSHWRARPHLPPHWRETYGRSWAATTLASLGVSARATGTPRLDRGLYLGNHISYLDIPMLMTCGVDTFLAKREIGAWPLIGSCARMLGTILVDRSSKASRQQSARRVGQRGINQPVVVFASGTTQLVGPRAKAWRSGAWDIAQEFNLPIQPFRLRYTPQRLAAYIHQDSLLGHLWRLNRSNGVAAHLEWHPEVFKPPFSSQLRQDIWHWAEVAAGED